MKELVKRVGYISAVFQYLTCFRDITCLSAELTTFSADFLVGGEVCVCVFGVCDFKFN